jgi:hypothetical protein
MHAARSLLGGAIGGVTNVLGGAASAVTGAVTGSTSAVLNAAGSAVHGVSSIVLGSGSDDSKAAAPVPATPSK